LLVTVKQRSAILGRSTQTLKSATITATLPLRILPLACSGTPDGNDCDGCPADAGSSLIDLRRDFATFFRIERPMIIRPEDAADLDSLLRLRNHYISNSYATFDEELMPKEAVSAWLGSFSRSGPYRLFVATESGRLLGFAGSQQYRNHPAFKKTIETSIYVDPEAVGRGVGSALYESLFKEISAEDLHCAVVGIALPNEASVRLHRKAGFTEVGTFAEYAFKNGRYVSSVWMQRAL
jgi:phosphinothricin acetyltransferase